MVGDLAPGVVHEGFELLEPDETLEISKHGRHSTLSMMADGAGRRVARAGRQ
jgi:hypothetical protein